MRLTRLRSLSDRLLLWVLFHEGGWFVVLGITFVVTVAEAVYARLHGRPFISLVEFCCAGALVWAFRKSFRTWRVYRSMPPDQLAAMKRAVAKLVRSAR